MPLVLPSTLCDTLRRAVAETPGGDKKPPARRKPTKPAAKKPAAKKPRIRKDAKGASPRPRVGLSKAQTKERTIEIVRLRILFPSWTWEQIAGRVTETAPKWKITAVGAFTAYQRHLDEKSEDLALVRSGELSGVVQEQLEGLRLLREYAAAILLEASQGYYRIRERDGTTSEVRIAANPNVALGAISRIAELRMAEVEFLQAMNLVPKSLGVVKLEFDAKAMMKAFHAVLDRFVPAKQREDANASLVEALHPTIVQGALEPAQSE